MTTAQDVLRHYLRTLAYRFDHVVTGTPAAFADFQAGAGVRTPGELVRHMTGLLRFARRQFEDLGDAELEPLGWEGERDRFVEGLRSLDRVLATGMAIRNAEMRFEQVWQGPLLDAMTHVGQLATLRRLAGSPCKRVRYWAVEMPALGD